MKNLNILLDNVSINSNSGPNSFARKLHKYLSKKGNRFDKKPDIILSFIQSTAFLKGVPAILRLDGIYFNTLQDYHLLNKNIRDSYHKADGVIIQSEFDKELIFRYFGEHPSAEVIHNGADNELIDTLEPLKNKITDSYSNLWCCASSWRPHKRLNDNIRYFQEHSAKDDCLIIAGNVGEKDRVKQKNIYYVGNLDYEPLLRLYKTSKYFIHLAWLDHCPNVVVDAKSAGCKLICSSEGGTAELADKDDIMVVEEPWNFEPVELYNPPRLDFTKKKIIKNDTKLCYNMDNVADKYLKYMRGVLRNASSS
tara:strand:+ start:4239 stop:5165 length:927 start_codon:yes stop_codon:yes gene_type:complete